MQKAYCALVFLGLIMSCSLSFSQSTAMDTVRLSQKVEIVGKVSLPKSIRIDDSLTNEFFKTQNLSDVLQLSTAFNFRTYGMGGLSSAGLRGLGASATKLYWNNIPINNGITGQSDFSMFNSGLFEQVNLSSSHENPLLNSGALAANIELQSDISTTKKVVFSLGSFQRLGLAVQLPFVGKKLRYQISLNGRHDKNNFQYTDLTQPEKPSRTIENNSLRSFSAQQLLRYKMPNKSTVSMGSLVSLSNRQLPAAMGSAVAGEMQHDALVIHYLKLESLNGLELNASHQFQNIIYSDSLRDIESNANFNQIYSSAAYGLWIKPNWKIDFATKQKLELATNQGFEKPVNRYSQEWNIFQFWSIQEKLSFIVNSGIVAQHSAFVNPTGRVAINYQMPFNFHISPSFTLDLNQPSMNDLYWAIGGNPNLKPEESQKLALDIKQSSTSNRKLNWNHSIHVFTQKVQHKIQWQPTAGALWQASNVGEVAVFGAEFNARISTAFRKVKTGITANYVYNKAQNSLENELIYSPNHSSNSSIWIQYKHYQVQIIQNYTGQRFVSSNNLTALPHFNLYHLNFSYQKKQVMLSLSAQNLFDVDYMPMLWRPMPGRNFQFQLSWEF